MRRVSYSVHVQIILNRHLLYFTEIDYWRTPSRRFYAAKSEEFEQLLAKQQERKSLSLSLSRKRKASHFTEEENDIALSRIEDTIEDVSETCTS